MSSDETRQQVERIATSRVFSRSERMKRFLRFAVGQTLAGKQEELKEYTIALAVFDKPDTFDARLDPIVRVEAGRLRSKLREYYDTVGRSDPVRIRFPKRSYVPEVRYRNPSRAAAAPAPTEPARIQFRSVAVLPFSDLSAKNDQDYFCDGITEEIVNALSRVPDLQVAARTSVMRFKDQPVDVRGLGIELNVGAVLEGSVRRSGSRVRIAAQLINVADGYNLWSDIYDREIRDVFDVQQEISEAIVRALRTQLGTGVSLRRATPSGKAYQHYLRGRYHWNKRDEASLQRAARYFESAIAEDPRYALAYSGLADTNAALAWSGVIPPEVGWEKASIMASEALGADPSLAHAHASMAAVQAAYRADWQAAEKSFTRAIELDPRHAAAHEWFGVFCLAPLGRLEEATGALERAIEEDPVSPVVRAHLGLIEYLKGRHDTALEHFQASLDLDSNFYRAHWFAARAMERLGKLADALHFLEAATAQASRQPLIVGAMARCLALCGDAKGARRRLHQLRRMSRHVPPIEIADVHAALGEREIAFDFLDEAAHERGTRIVHLNVDPAYQDLRDDPRYSKLMAYLRLEPS